MLNLNSKNDVKMDAKIISKWVQNRPQNHPKAHQKATTKNLTKKLAKRSWFADEEGRVDLDWRGWRKAPKFLFEECEYKNHLGILKYSWYEIYLEWFEFVL